MTAFKLEGHTAIVTGGASGIGLATAHTLAEAGAAVVVADLNEEAGAQVAEALKERGADSLFVRTDVAEAGDVEALMAAVMERFGTLEILMHFAGIGREILALETTLAEWNRIIAVNLTGSFLMMQAAGAAMVEAGYGRIVSMSSVNPMSSISSASSRTTVVMSSSSSEPRRMWSMARPGVATTTCTPRRNACSWRWMGWPP